MGIAVVYQANTCSNRFLSIGNKSSSPEHTIAAAAARASVQPLRLFCQAAGEDGMECGGEMPDLVLQFQDILPGG